MESRLLNKKNGKWKISSALVKKCMKNEDKLHPGNRKLLFGTTHTANYHTFFQLFLSVGVQSFICSYEHKQNSKKFKFLLNQTTLYVYCEVLLLLFLVIIIIIMMEKNSYAVSFLKQKANIFQSSNIFSTATFLLYVREIVLWWVCCWLFACLLC